MDDIVIDTSLTATAAVRDVQLAREALSAAMRDAASACGDSEDAACKARVREAIKQEKSARANAQYAVKRATGLFPYELALMGL